MPKDRQRRAYPAQYRFAASPGLDDAVRMKHSTAPSARPAMRPAIRPAIRLWVRLWVRLLALALAGVAVAGCPATHASLRRGDAHSAEIEYTGDIASATILARAHCAQYERVARLSDKSEDVLVFDCVPRGPAAGLP